MTEEKCLNDKIVSMSEANFAPILERALKYSKKSQLQLFDVPKIILVGVGGAGNNIINRLYNIGVSGAETIAINTDKIHLDITQADTKILIGKTITKGLGAGGSPEVGRKSAELARGTLEDVLKDANLVFITAGLGGGTGTGVAPVVAQVAKDGGAFVIGIVTRPFKIEKSRMIKAEVGLNDLKKAADIVIVLDNNMLLNYMPNLPIDQAFSVMDQLISETITGIYEAITQPSLINLDLADVRAIMKGGGLAVMLVGEAKGQDKVNMAVKAALSHPLLDIDIKGATGGLLFITGGKDMSLREAEEVTRSMTFQIDPHASIIWCARVDKEFEGKIRVIAIFTLPNLDFTAKPKETNKVEPTSK